MSEAVLGAEAQSRRASRWDAVYLGVILGAGLGLAESPLLLLRRALTNRWMGVGLDALWLAPAVYITLFAGIGGAAALLAGRRGERRAMVQAAIAMQLFIAVFSALSIFRPMLHGAAVWLLAAGVARMCHQGTLRALARWKGTLAWRGAQLFLILLVSVWSIRGVARLRVMYSLAHRPPVSSHAPNVLLLILDTVRATDMALYQPAEATASGLASRGVLFERAYSTAPWTLPSHASIFTGRRPGEQHATWYRAMRQTWPTVAEAFQRSGYFTAATMANTENTSRETGLARGFDEYRDYPISLPWAINSTSLGRHVAASRLLREWLNTEQVVGRREAPEISQEVRELISEGGDRPWLIVANYFDAHAPYLPPAPYDSALAGFGAATRWQVPWRGSKDSAALHTAYRAAVAGLEAAVEELLRSLSSSDSGRETIIVITSDHGEEFGEHGIFEHGHDLFPQSLHVPLLIMGPPDVPRGIRVEKSVSLLDLAATLVDLAGLSPAHPPGGRSLRRHWEGGPEADDTAYAVLRRVKADAGRSPAKKGDLFAAIAGRYEYIERQDGDHTLLDLAVPRGQVLPHEAAGWESVAPSLVAALNEAYPPPVRRQGMASGFTTARHTE